MCECLVMLFFHVMYFGIGRFSFCLYATRILTSALVSKGQISVCNISPILKPALYKYHIIIIIIIIIIISIACVGFYISNHIHGFLGGGVRSGGWGGWFGVGWSLVVGGGGDVGVGVG